jgi:small subunit ribosomal protein S10
MTTLNKTRITLKSFDHRALDQAVHSIKHNLKANGMSPAVVPMPTRMQKFTVIRSPHIDKKSREQFEIRTHKCIIDVPNPDPNFGEILRRISLTSAVEVSII